MCVFWQSLYLALILLSAAIAPTIVVAQTNPPVVTVTVDCSKTVQVVDPHMLGINTAAWDSDYRSPDVIRLLKTTSISTFRYPGGSWADSFDWTKPRFKGMPMTKDLGILAESVNGDASIIFNYGSGSPQMAAAWASYCDSKSDSTIVIGVDGSGRDWKTAGYWASLRSQPVLAVDDGLNPLRANHPLPYHFTKFEVGNECYGSWESDTHPQKHDPVLYASFFADTYALVKKIVPTAQLGAVITDSEDDDGDQQEAVTNPITKQPHSGWTAVVLNTLNGLNIVPDFLVFHHYPEQPGRESDHDLLDSARDWPSEAHSIRQLLTQYMRGKAQRSDLACTENNSVTFNPGKQTTSLVDGLYYADSFGSVLMTEFHSFYWWNLHNGISPQYNNSQSLYGWRNYGDYGALASGTQMPHTGDNTPYPTFRAMQLISKFCGGGDYVVSAFSSSPDISIYAVRRKNEGLSLLLINKSPSKTAQVQAALTDFLPKVKATVFSYGVAQDNADMNGLPSELAQSQMQIGIRSLNVDISPYTITVIQLQRR